MNRIEREFVSLKENPIEFVEFFKTPDKLQWVFVIKNVKNTYYSNTSNYGIINFGEKYPFFPPAIKFISNIVHPNIYKDGNICLSYLRSSSDETGYYNSTNIWAPGITIFQIFVAIVNLLHEPQLNSPANVDAKKMWECNNILSEIQLNQQKYYMVHYTTKEAYENILIYDHILTNTSVINYGLSIPSGFGNINNKKIGDPNITLTENIDYIISNKYTEAPGSYFRLERNITSSVPNNPTCTLLNSPK